MANILNILLVSEVNVYVTKYLTVRALYKRNPAHNTAVHFSVGSTLFNSKNNGHVHFVTISPSKVQSVEQDILQGGVSTWKSSSIRHELCLLSLFTSLNSLRYLTKITTKHFKWFSHGQRARLQTLTLNCIKCNVIIFRLEWITIYFAQTYRQNTHTTNKMKQITHKSISFSLSPNYCCLDVSMAF